MRKTNAPKVYFCPHTESANVSRFISTVFQEYDNASFSLPEKLAIKVHSGERGNKNFLKPLYVRHCIHTIPEISNGTIVECNTAYEGARHDFDSHSKLMTEHGWTDEFATFEILDAYTPDLVLNIPNGKVLKKNYVGKGLKNYKSCLVISHFKGHPMGGFGGALKQLSIGFASAKGKVYIHGYGSFERGQENLTTIKSANQEAFITAMADAASSIVSFFKNHIMYINFMKDISVSCDCDANAPAPCMKDIGVLVSLDPVAIDQACYDLLEESHDKGSSKVLNRIHSLQGDQILKDAEALGIGSRSYTLKELDITDNAKRIKEEYE